MKMILIVDIGVHKDQHLVKKSAKDYSKKYIHQSIPPNIRSKYDIPKMTSTIVALSRDEIYKHRIGAKPSSVCLSRFQEISKITTDIENSLELVRQWERRLCRRNTASSSEIGVNNVIGISSNAPDDPDLLVEMKKAPEKKKVKFEISEKDRREQGPSDTKKKSLPLSTQNKSLRPRAMSICSISTRSRGPAEDYPHVLEQTIEHDIKLRTEKTNSSNSTKKPKLRDRAKSLYIEPEENVHKSINRNVLKSSDTRKEPPIDASKSKYPIRSRRASIKPPPHKKRERNDDKENTAVENSADRNVEKEAKSLENLEKFEKMCANPPRIPPNRRKTFFSDGKFAEHLKVSRRLSLNCRPWEDEVDSKESQGKLTQIKKRQSTTETCLESVTKKSKIDVVENNCSISFQFSNQLTSEVSVTFDTLKDPSLRYLIKSNQEKTSNAKRRRNRQNSISDVSQLVRKRKLVQNSQPTKKVETEPTSAPKKPVYAQSKTQKKHDSEKLVTEKTSDKIYEFSSGENSDTDPVKISPRRTRLGMSRMNQAGGNKKSAKRGPETLYKVEVSKKTKCKTTVLGQMKKKSTYTDTSKFENSSELDQGNSSQSINESNEISDLSVITSKTSMTPESQLATEIIEKNVEASEVAANITTTEPTTNAEETKSQESLISNESILNISGLFPLIDDNPPQENFIFFKDSEINDSIPVTEPIIGDPNVTENIPLSENDQPHQSDPTTTETTSTPPPSPPLTEHELIKKFHLKDLSIILKKTLNENLYSEIEVELADSVKPSHLNDSSSEDHPKINDGDNVEDLKSQIVEDIPLSENMDQIVDGDGNGDDANGDDTATCIYSDEKNENVEIPLVDDSVQDELPGSVEMKDVSNNSLDLELRESNAGDDKPVVVPDKLSEENNEKEENELELKSSDNTQLNVTVETDRNDETNSVYNEESDNEATEALCNSSRIEECYEEQEPRDMEYDGDYDMNQCYDVDVISQKSTDLMERKIDTSEIQEEKPDKSPLPAQPSEHLSSNKYIMIIEDSNEDGNTYCKSVINMNDQFKASDMELHLKHYEPNSEYPDDVCGELTIPSENQNDDSTHYMDSNQEIPDLMEDQVQLDNRLENEEKADNDNSENRQYGIWSMDAIVVNNEMLSSSMVQEPRTTNQSAMLLGKNLRTMQPEPKKRGRPRGSKNSPKTSTTTGPEESVKAKKVPQKKLGINKRRNTFIIPTTTEFPIISGYVPQPPSYGLGLQDHLSIDSHSSNLYSSIPTTTCQEYNITNSIVQTIPTTSQCVVAPQKKIVMYPPKPSTTTSTNTLWNPIQPVSSVTTKKINSRMRARSNTIVSPIDFNPRMVSLVTSSNETITRISQSQQQQQNEFRNLRSYNNEPENR